MVDFSFCRRITEALEADEVVRITTFTSDSDEEGSLQDMEVDGDLSGPDEHVSDSEQENMEVETDPTN